MTLTLPQLKGHNLLTHSRMATMKTCAQKGYLAYELGLRPDDSAKPLRMGAAFHIGLECRAQGIGFAAAVESTVARYETLPPWATTDDKVHEWLVERETVVRLLDGYYWRWAVADANPNDPFGVAEVIANEQAFEIPIINPETGAPTPLFKLAGKIDKIVRLTDGRIAVMEHKTASDDLDPTSDYWKRLRIDQQISAYYLAARALGHDIQTVLYDVTRKPTIGPLQIPLVDEDNVKIVLDAAGERVRTKDGKKWRESGDAAQGYMLQCRVQTPKEFGDRLTADIRERPDYYYRRQEIPRLDKDLEDFRYELWQMQQQLRDSQRHGRWFRNTSSCIGFGKCAYFDICTNSIDVLEQTPPGFVRVNEIHPELEISNG